MYIKLFIGYLFASLIQAGIVAGSETLGISNLQPKMDIMQLINHILVGQIAGFVLLLLVRKFEFIKRMNTWFLGSSYGLIIWSIILPLASNKGTIQAPWEQGFITISISLIAFITFGIITALTTKKYET